MFTSFSWRCWQIVAVDIGETMLKFQFACIDPFPSLQIRKTTQTSDWCFVCVQDLFVKIDFSGSKMIHHRKFHSVRKFFVMHQRWCPLQTAFLHLRESTKILEAVCSFIISKLRFWFCWNLTETPQKMKRQKWRVEERYFSTHFCFVRK